MIVKQDCPFCRSNGLLKGDVTASTPTAYMISDKNRPGYYLIIPESHAESIEELADSWWQDVKTLVPQVPGLTPDYNLSFNIGKRDGKSVKHLHLWVIPRTDGQSASGTGLAGLIARVNE
jgi:diadenosine tetraphosphate (Ap4A) HIT family hydrolase